MCVEFRPVSAVLGGKLMRSMQFRQDVSGYVCDGTFLQNWMVLIFAERVDWQTKYFVKLQYHRKQLSNYMLLVDRDTLSAVVGASF